MRKPHIMLLLILVLSSFSIAAVSPFNEGWQRQIDIYEIDSMSINTKDGLVTGTPCYFTKPFVERMYVGQLVRISNPRGFTYWTKEKGESHLTCQ